MNGELIQELIQDDMKVEKADDDDDDDDDDDNEHHNYQVPPKRHQPASADPQSI